MPNELPELTQKRIIDKTVIDIESVLKFYKKSLIDVSDQERKMYFDIYQAGMIAAIDHATKTVRGEEEKGTK